MPKAMLIDITLCIGCEACSEACREVNHLPKNGPKQLCADTYQVVDQIGPDQYVRRQCMHCLEPACVSVCPVGALEKNEEFGCVTWVGSKCLGCRYCMMSCPFDVPRYEWTSPNPEVRKCVFCLERQQKGQPPACAEACPTGATKYGERDALLKEAAERIKAEPKKYVNHIYGQTEIGGTSFLYLSPVPFEMLHLPGSLPQEEMPEYTWKVLSQIPHIVLIGGVFLGGMKWLTNRKNDILKVEPKPMEASEAPADREKSHE
jgi:formate dehydrogenase iron-sulfur subunit